jgi:hypothetical protein
LNKVPATAVFSHIEVTDGRVWLKPTGPSCFAGDLSEKEQKLVYATHYAPAAELFNKNAAGVAWKSKPSWYVLANNDQTVHPDLQRFVSKRMGASTHPIDSSHVPMLSHPDFVVDVIVVRSRVSKTVSHSGLRQVETRFSRLDPIVGISAYTKLLQENVLKDPFIIHGRGGTFLAYIERPEPACLLAEEGMIRQAVLTDAEILIFEKDEIPGFDGAAALLRH